MSSLLTPCIAPHIVEDLKKKMVFLGGPRQVGKTTFAQSLLKNYKDGHPGYLNWDDTQQRGKIRTRDWPADQKLIVLDEIHKAKDWRTILKGTYDTLKNSHQFLVTGSAKLDYFLKGGDSLLGRFNYYRMHPFSLNEAHKNVSLTDLLKFGGFPEPLLAGSEKELRRWHMQRRERVVFTDIRDLENLRDVSQMELLVGALPARVGSPLSRKSLGEDLQIDQKTVEKWIQILERVYYCYRIPPFGSPRIRAVKKEQKLYFWDWSEHTQDRGKRWENFVASQLLKFCHYQNDVEGHPYELRYLRDTSLREVDFVVMNGKAPVFAVECKSGDRELSPALKYFSERTKIPKFYQVYEEGKTHRHITDTISIMSFKNFSEEVGLV